MNFKKKSSNIFVKKKMNKKCEIWNNEPAFFFTWWAEKKLKICFECVVPVAVIESHEMILLVTKHVITPRLEPLSQI